MAIVEMRERGRRRARPAAIEDNPRGSSTRGSLDRAGPGALDSDHMEIRIWLRLLSCTTRIENYLKSRIMRDFGTSLARFDVMAQLDRFEDGLTMTELSRRLLVSNGAITGLVDKLEADNLVVRDRDEADKRSMIVRLTAGGRGQFREMAVRHEEWVISLLGELSQGARAELLGSLTLLKRRLDERVDDQAS